MIKKSHPKLNEFLATSICGNDILSSALYVSGIAAIFAGVYAPLVLLLVAAVLYLYRAVYREVVEAMPINGGVYNCLLNATSKTFAAVAGVMTILSYIATAVISAKVGVEYLHAVLPALPVFTGTVILLMVFALLVILGVKESAKVAVVIFTVHVFTLTVFILSGINYFFSIGMQTLTQNIRLTSSLFENQGIFTTFFLAFSASLLGISGFESSANFVEEQDFGVFSKTLRNMWIGVSIFNPLVAFVVISSMQLPEIAAAKDFLLVNNARIIGGEWFGVMMAVNAFLVLAGAVLTAYIGVIGLIQRMSLDGCLPSFLVKENTRGAHQRIIITFFILTTSILILTRGNLLSLAGVYTISFLGVMSLFALGNLILRETRSDLKRPFKAPLLYVILAFMATIGGIVGNLLIDGKNIYFFSIYFIPAVLLVFGMIYQEAIFKFLIRVTVNFSGINNWLKFIAAQSLSEKFAVFIHHPSRLFHALQYIDHNETGKNITLVHCLDDNCQDKAHDPSFTEIKKLLPSLKIAGVFPHLNLELKYVDAHFGPQAVTDIARLLNINKNRIFIGSLHHYHDFDYHELGGVRIISD